MKASKLGLLRMALLSGGVFLASSSSPVRADSWQMTTTTTTTSISGSGPAPMSAGDCDPNVIEQMGQIQQANIQAQAALASNVFTFLPATGMAAVSCLSNLGQGLGIIFDPPNLMGLLQNLINQACNQVEMYKNEAMAPIVQAGNSVTSGMPQGQLAPGVNISSLTGGVYLSQGASSPNSISMSNNSVAVNVTSILRNNAPPMSSFSGGLLAAPPPTNGPVQGDLY